MAAYKSASSVAGSGLFAGRDFQAGEAAFLTARPFVTALDTKRLSDTCANCFVWTAKSKIGDRGSGQEGANVRVCLGCHTLSYCSKVRKNVKLPETHFHLEEDFRTLHDGLLATSVLQV